MQEILDFLQSLDWSPLVISIKTGIVATILSFFFGIFAARAVMKLRPGARAVIDGFLTLPMILPPTVAGFFLLLIFSLRRPFGAALYENFSIKAVQTWLGCILAATIIAFPLMYRNTRAAFEQVVHSNTYRRMDGEELRRIFDGRTGGEEFCSWMQAFHRRKYDSGFAREMNRSVQAYLRDLEEEEPV